MQSGKVTVIARLRARAGMEEQLRRELLALVEPSRSDEGCISYNLHQAIEDRTLFVFHENWESEEHLKKHTCSPHCEAFRFKARNLLASPPELLLLEMIG